MRIKPIGPNQTELFSSGWIIFFSYATPVAAISPDGEIMVTSKRWSRITSKHITKWLNGRKADYCLQKDLDTIGGEL